VLWLVGRPEREGLLGRHRQDDDIKIDLKEKDGKVWNGFIWLLYGNESASSKKCSEIPE